MTNVSFSIAHFLRLNSEEFLGILSDHHAQNHVDLTSLQSEAWKKEFEDLKLILNGKNGRVLFEYSIPSFSKAIDVVLLLNGKIFVIEYKAREQNYNKQDIIQVQRYALLLKYCHNRSNDNWIVPILVATEATFSEVRDDRNEEDDVYNTILTNSNDLGKIIAEVNENLPYCGDDTWETEWENGIYKASPTIIEAAKNVWRENNVSGFKKGESNKKTRLSAEEYVKNVVVKETQSRPEGQRKSICFVTGVPGAGKTLVGLDLSVALQDFGASMLSGNGPLVAVMTAALKRDRDQLKKEKATLKDDVSVESIIRSAYGYKKEIFEKRLQYENGTGKVYLKEGADRGSQHVIIFDEAQRAWTQKKMIKPGQAGKKYWQEDQFPFSEPGILLWDMNLRDWGVFVCLVGGGQEIHDGEAGICEWLKALRENDELAGWHIYMADELKGAEYNRKDDSNRTIEDYREFFFKQGRLTVDQSLHLTASQRTPRSEKVSAFVQELLECEKEKAVGSYKALKNKYPIFITRNLEKAKEKLIERQLKIAPLNSENIDDTRIGMLMTSNAERLRPYGFVQTGASKSDSKMASWFLDSSRFVNSSNFLEIALDEFCVQGLELDLDVVMWDADFRYNSKNNDWDYYKFNGQFWSPVDKTKTNYLTQRFYMKNAYRVLLTRARKGMIIFVPEGSEKDPTRLPAFYDGTYAYLKGLGIKEI